MITRRKSGPLNHPPHGRTNELKRIEESNLPPRKSEVAQNRQPKPRAKENTMARELPKPALPKTGMGPTHEEIAQRAYQIFVERGRPEGRDQEHWLEAEAQLTATRQQQLSAGSTDKKSTTPQRTSFRG